MRRLIIFTVVTAWWLCAVHVLFEVEPRSLVQPLTNELRVADRGPLRRSNPEWDLMARTFTTLAFLNQLDARPELLSAVDEIIDETLAMDEAGDDTFVLPYFHAKPFADARTRSVFVDGELALMLASRELVAPTSSPRYREALRQRVDRFTAAMERGPVLSAESYPDEAWTFCNTIALAATRVSDAVDGRDHTALRQAWLARAREGLVDQRTGLLISSFTWRGEPLDGPEGSTLYLAAHMLQLVDDDFARTQYTLARQHLVTRVLGFAWSAEWPRAWKGPDDVDSGPTVPLLDANAGASGLALVGAAAFADRETLTALVSSLRIGAFPLEHDGRLRFAAGNTLADAVLLYAAVLDDRGAPGPVFQRALSSTPVALMER